MTVIASQTIEFGGGNEIVVRKTPAPNGPGFGTTVDPHATECKESTDYNTVIFDILNEGLCVPVTVNTFPHEPDVGLAE